MNKLEKFVLCGKYIRLSAHTDYEGKPCYSLLVDTDGAFTLDELIKVVEDIKKDFDDILPAFPEYRIDAEKNEMVVTGYTMCNDMINRFEEENGGRGCDADGTARA